MCAGMCKLGLASVQYRSLVHGHRLAQRCDCRLDFTVRLRCGARLASPHAIKLDMPALDMLCPARSRLPLCLLPPALIPANKHTFTDCRIAKVMRENTVHAIHSRRNASSTRRGVAVKIASQLCGRRYTARAVRGLSEGSFARLCSVARTFRAASALAAREQRAAPRSPRPRLRRHRASTTPRRGRFVRSIALRPCPRPAT